MFILIFCIHIYILKIFGSNTVEASPFSLESLQKYEVQPSPFTAVSFTRPQTHMSYNVCSELGGGAVGSTQLCIVGKKKNSANSLTRDNECRLEVVMVA